MVRLSIIVPFYNVEKYIEQCIRSLYDQDIPLEEYEVICVDDCSPDGSRAIVEHLQKEYPNLQLIIHERNKKQGGARNTGLKAAKGEYIWFVDSDDCIIPNCLETLLRDAENNDVDMLQFDFQILIGNERRPNSVSYEDNQVYSGPEFVVNETHIRWYYRISEAWIKLHKRSFLLENDLMFVEDVMYEDTDLSLHMFTLAKRVKHINLAPYCYRYNPTGVTKKKRTAETMMYTILHQDRCLKVIEMAPTMEYRDLVIDYVKAQLTQLRLEIKGLSTKEHFRYAILMNRVSIDGLHAYCNWRTWLAIKYGITWFVKV